MSQCCAYLIRYLTSAYNSLYFLSNRSLDDYRNLISQCDVGEVALRAVVTRPVDSVTARRKLADNWLQKSKLESVYETANNGHHENNLEARKASNLMEVCHLRSIYRGEDENLISVVTKVRRQLDLCENEDESKSPTWNYATATDTPQSEAEEEVDELAIESVGTEGSMQIAYMPTDALMCSKVASLIFLSSLLYCSSSYQISIKTIDIETDITFL